MTRIAVFIDDFKKTEECVGDGCATVTRKDDVEGRKPSTDEFDMLLILEQYAADCLRPNNLGLDFVKKFVKSGKPTLAIYRGSQYSITPRDLEDENIADVNSIIANAEQHKAYEEFLKDRGPVGIRM